MARISTPKKKTRIFKGNCKIKFQNFIVMLTDTQYFWGANSGTSNI